MRPIELINVKEKKVKCNGGDAASFHPTIYLDMGDNDYVICPYCSKYFTMRNNLYSSASDVRKINLELNKNKSL